MINPTAKQGTSNDNSAEESVANSPLFRTNTFNIPPASARATATFTFPSYIEEPIIVYPGAIVCFLQIIAAIPKMIDEQVRNRFEYFC